MNKITFGLLAVCLNIFVCCDRINTNEIIADTIGQKITIDLPKSDNTPFTILRYISKPSCTSCQLKTGTWKAYQKRLKHQFHNDVSICILCETTNIKEAEHLLNMYGFRDHALVDSVLNFYENNNLNSSLGNDVVFLLDSTSTILSIGDSIKNTKTDSLFTNIISTRLQNK